MKLLGQDLHEPAFDYGFDYCRVVGKLLYLEKSLRREIAYAVHQCARYCKNPRRSHGEALKRIGRYLVGTADKGMIIKPAVESFVCCVDASHASD